jgi:hypothetical protein
MITDHDVAEHDISGVISAGSPCGIERVGIILGAPPPALGSVSPELAGEYRQASSQKVGSKARPSVRPPASPYQCAATELAKRYGGHHHREFLAQVRIAMQCVKLRFGRA